MCFQKRYRKEDLYVVWLYKYDAKSRNYNLSECRITTRKLLKNKRFGSVFDTIECLDGSSYSMSQSNDPLSALSGSPLLEVAKIKDSKKKFKLAEIFQLQGCLNNNLEKRGRTNKIDLEDIEIDAKDLF